MTKKRSLTVEQLSTINYYLSEDWLELHGHDAGRTKQERLVALDAALDAINTFEEAE
jgi:hypothetical protein